MRLDHFLATRGPRLTPTARAGADAAGRRRRPLRPLQEGHPPGAGAAERPGHGPRRRRSPGSRSSTGRSASARPSRPPAPRSTSRTWSTARRLVYMAPEALLDPQGGRPRRPTSSRSGRSPTTSSRAGRPATARPRWRRMLRRAPGPEDLRRARRRRAGAGGAGPLEHRPGRRPADPTAADFLEYLDARRGRADRPRRRTTSPTRPRPAAATAWRAASWSSGSWAEGATGVALLARRGERGVRPQGRPRRPRTTTGSARRPRRSRRSAASSSSACTTSARSAAGRCWCSTRPATRRWPSGCARRAGCGLDLLQRFGEDLLQAVASLERHGVAHRDIKPDNIGVRSGKQRLQLVLFDFSLSRVPGRADPGRHAPVPRPVPAAPQAAPLGPGGRAVRGRGDALRDGHRRPAALGRRPLRPGADRRRAGRSRPSGSTRRSARAWSAFFRTALDRDPARRFDNAEEMLRAWREVFDEAERRDGHDPGRGEVAAAGRTSTRPGPTRRSRCWA